MKYDVDTCIEFFEAYNEEVYDKNVISEMSLSDIRYNLYQALFNKLETKLAVFSVSREEIEKKYPHFIAPYDNKERAYAPGYYYFTTANPSDTTLADFIPKDLEKTRLDCICSNDKILFIPSEKFSDKFVEDEANCLGYDSYSKYVKDGNYDGVYYGIKDTESLKEYQEITLDYSLDKAFEDFAENVTLTLKTKDFEYTIFSSNPLNEDFLEDLKTGEIYQSEDNNTADYNEEVPKEIREFLLAWEDKPLKEALAEYEANQELNFNKKDAIEMMLDYIAEGENFIANTLANYLLEEKLEDDNHIPMVLMHIYNEYLDDVYEEYDTRETIESYQNDYTRLAIAMLYPKDKFSQNEFESVSNQLIYKNNGYFENVKELKDKLNEEIEQYEQKHMSEDKAPNKSIKKQR